MLRKLTYLQSEAYQSHENLADDLEARVRTDHRLEFVRLSDVRSDKLLQVLDSVEPQHEPEFQGAESASERNLPMLQRNRSVNVWWRLHL